MIKIDKKYRMYPNNEYPINCIIHIRAIVDKEQVVYKKWFRTKQRWRYFVDSIIYFNLLEKNNELKKIN